MGSSSNPSLHRSPYTRPALRASLALGNGGCIREEGRADGAGELKPRSAKARPTIINLIGKG